MSARTFPVISVVALSALVLLGVGEAEASSKKRHQDRLQADEAVAQILGGTGTDGALARLKYLGQEDYAFDQLVPYTRTVSERQRRDVVMALATLAGPGNDGVFRRLFDDEDGAVRMYAVRGFGKSKSRDVKALVPLLEDKTMGVRREAARVLGLMRQPAAGKPLMIAAQTEDELEVRVELLQAVGLSGDRKQAKPLTAQLNGSSESTRVAAARALCHLGAPEGFGYAKKLLASADRDERRQAVELFEGANAKTARKLLLPLLQDSDRVLAARAGRVLHQGGEPKMLEYLVVQAHRSEGEDRRAFEKELEALEVERSQREQIWKKASRGAKGKQRR